MVGGRGVKGWRTLTPVPCLPKVPQKYSLCLEMINSFMSLPFAWLGLTLLAVLVATLLGLYFWRSRNKNAKTKPSSGFTCPCYAPSWRPAEKETE